ncbi:MAG: DUF2793 domain-containing protein [Pseudomonadota bacterium]
MPETPRLTLPLLEAAQAQKHVSVNEALARLDTLAAQRAEDLGLTTPPATPADGTLFGIGSGAGGAWAGQDGRMALYLNGGWAFADPWEGWQLYDASTGALALYRSGAWVGGVAGGSPGGALTLSRVIEVEHTLSAGAVSTTPALIPDKAVVLGASARVTQAIAGATSWSLGVSGAPDRYGVGYGVAQGAYAAGVTGQPQAYYGATALTLTAEGGAFSAGAVRLAVHLLEIVPPPA